MQNNIKKYTLLLSLLLTTHTQSIPCNKKHNIPGIIIGSTILVTSGVMAFKYGLIAFLAHCANAHRLRNKALVYTTMYTGCGCTGWALLTKSIDHHRCSNRNPNAY